MTTGDEKWVMYNNQTRKRSWTKEGEKAQAIKPWIDDEEGDVCVYGGIGKESFTMSCYCLVKQLISNSTVNNWRDYNKQLRGSG